MPQLYYEWGSMNAGKSTKLLQAAFNYRERGMHVHIFIPEVINSEFIVSRLGIKEKAQIFSKQFNFYEELKDSKVHCILIDEAQFLTKKQVRQLTKVVDEYEIPVLCYGLRTDFKGELFEGSTYLFAWADKIREIKTVCSCAKKATMTMRIETNTDGSYTGISSGNQVEVGGNNKYISLCRKCYSAHITDF